MTLQRLIAISVTLCILAASSGSLGTGTFPGAAANPDGTLGLPGRKLSGWGGGGWNGGGWGGGFNHFDGRGGSAAAASSAAAAGFGRKLSGWWGGGWNGGFNHFDGGFGGSAAAASSAAAVGRKLHGVERVWYCKDGKVVDGNGVVASSGLGWWPFLWTGKRFTDCTADGFWGPDGGVTTSTFPNGGFAEAAASTGRKMHQFGGFHGNGGGDFHNGGFHNDGFHNGGGSAAAASSAAAAGRDSAAAAAAAAAAGRG